MKTKKLVSLLFAICMLLSVVSAISLTASAETTNLLEVCDDCITFSSDEAFSIDLAKGSSCTATVSLEYSTDKTNWSTFNVNTYYSAGYDGSTYNLYLRGTGNTTFGSGTSQSTACTFKAETDSETSEIFCSGNIMTLLDYKTVANNQEPAMGNYAFSYLFNGFITLKTAPELPAKTLAAYCYYYMFYNCNALITAPELPATTLASNCYYYMFYKCTTLTTAPALLATDLCEKCYYGMFNNCTALTTEPEISAINLSPNCCAYMFKNCTALTTAPALLATDLCEKCYCGMFQGCTALTSAPALSNITLGKSCCYYMFYGCTHLYITSVDEQGKVTWSIPASSASSPVYNMTGSCYTGSATVAVPTEGTNYYRVVGVYDITNSTAEADSATNNGYIAADAMAPVGNTVTVTVTPASGYELDTLKYNDGTSDTTITAAEGVYSFAMPAKAVTVSATFKKAPHTHDGVTYETELTKAFITGLPGDSSNNGYLLPTGTYYLTEDIVDLRSNNQRIYIRGNSDVKICLNGHKLNAWIITAGNASLTICSCKDGGKIVDNSLDLGAYDDINFSGATTLRNVVFESNIVSNGGSLFVMENCTVQSTNSNDTAVKLVNVTSATIKDTEISGFANGIGISGACNVTLNDVTLNNISNYDISIYGIESKKTNAVLTINGETTADKIEIENNYIDILFGDDFTNATTEVTIDENSVTLPCTIGSVYSENFKCTQLPYHITDVDGKAVLDYRIEEQPAQSNDYTFTLDADSASTSKVLQESDVAYQWYKFTEKKFGDYGAENIEIIGVNDIYSLENPESGKCYVIAGTVSGNTATSQTYYDEYQMFGFAFKNDSAAPAMITFTSDDDLTGFVDFKGKPLTPVDGKYTISLGEMSETVVACCCYKETTSAYDFENITFTLSSPVTGQTTNKLTEYEDGATYYCGATLAEDGTKISSESVTTPPEDVKNAKYYTSLALNESIDINLKIKSLGEGFDEKLLTITVDGKAADGQVEYDKATNTLSCMVKAVAPKDIGTDWNIVVTYDGVQVKNFTYSVKKYCDKVFAKYAEDHANGTPTCEYDALNTLCEALLNYGKYAEDYANSNTDSTVNEGHEITFGSNYGFDGLKDENAVLGDYAGKGSAAYLSLGSTIKLNFILKNYEGDLLSTGYDENGNVDKDNPQNFYVLNDKKTPEQIDPKRVKVTLNDDGDTVVSVDLYASQLSTSYTLKLKDVPTDDFCITYGVYNYCSDAQGKSADVGFTDTVKTLCKAIHNYSKAVQAYIKSTAK